LAQYSADSNYGGGSLVSVNWATGNHKNGLLYVDLSTHAGKTVSVANLHILEVSVSENPVPCSFYEVAADWAEMEATWNDRLTGVPWTTAGGDFGSLISTETIARCGWEVIDFSTIIQAWLDGSKTNRGWLLHRDTVSSVLLGFATEEAAAANRPYLELTLSS